MTRQRADRGSGSIQPYIRNGVRHGWQGYATIGTIDGKQVRRHVYAATKA